MIMLEKIKVKIKKILLLLRGRFAYIKTGIRTNKEWYGNQYGGFYVFPGCLNEKSVVYSFGIGEDISFDEAVIRKHNCSVFGFDPTPKSIDWIRSRLDKLPSQFSFFEYGIGVKSGFVDFYLPKNTGHVSGSFVQQPNVDAQQKIRVELKSLSDIAAQLNHKKIDVLKMDIEGAEYQVMQNILNSSVRIDQILVEFHERFFKDGSNRTANTIKALKDHGFEIFGISDSFEEVSFINKRVL